MQYHHVLFHIIASSFPLKDPADFYYMVMIYNTSLVLQSIHENPFETGI